MIKELKQYPYVYLLIISFIIFLLLVAFYKVKVDTYESGKLILICKNGELISELFNVNDGFWNPGDLNEKTLYIKNTSSFDAQVYNIAFTCNLKDSTGKIFNSSSKEYKDFVNNMKVSLKSGNKTLYSGNYEGLINNGLMLGSSFPIYPNETKTIVIIMKFESSSGNSLHNVTDIFDINIDYSMSNKLGSSGYDKLVKTGTFTNYFALIFTICALIALGIKFYYVDNNLH